MIKLKTRLAYPHKFVSSLHKYGLPGLNLHKIIFKFINFENMQYFELIVNDTCVQKGIGLLRGHSSITFLWHRGWDKTIIIYFT